MWLTNNIGNWEQSSILENITNKEVNTLPAASAQPPKPRGPLKDIVDGQQTMDGRKIVCIPIETEPSYQLINPPALPGLKTLGIIAPPVLMRLMLQVPVIWTRRHNFAINRQQRRKFSSNYFIIISQMMMDCKRHSTTGWPKPNVST